ncbi:MAG: DNA repair protein RadC [Verrucomicrobiae bacterium]|nr:DNA repair protein RadC [Verrucomicrobiae bacterium]
MPEIYQSRIKSLAVQERPQERLDKYGPGSLRDADLLAMLIRSGTAKLDVLSLSDKLLHQAGSLPALINWTKEDFMKIEGIGTVKALQLVAVMEFARRVIRGRLGESPLLDSPEAVFEFVSPLTHGLSVEKFWTLCLNRKNRLLREIEVTVGTANSSLVHPREVFRDAVRLGSSAIIVFHNHPSGDPAPSSADIQVTRRLREAAQIMDIDLLDHVIVGHPDQDPRKLGYYSFKDAGLL